MNRRLLLVAALLATCLVVLVPTAGANRGHGHGQRFTFAGELLADPGANATTVSVQVETGNRPALHALIGASQNQVFAVGPGTEVLVWSHGVPHVGSTADLHQGDWVNVAVRAARGSSLQELENTPAATVADRAAPRGGLPLWLFAGSVAGPQSGGHVALHVEGGNWKALLAMLGQPLDQSFAYDDGTIFLLWQGKVPTVIDPSQLQAGDRITVRIRAPRTSTLAQVEATPAAHVGDHEPAPPPED
jgi:hypothetical protein